jgi:phage shock protein A
VILVGIDYPTAPEVKNALEKAQESLKQATVNADALQAKHDEATASLEAYKREFNADSIAQAVSERVALMAEASKVVNLDALQGKSEREIQEAVIKSKHADINLDGKSDDYVKASYDMVMKAIPSKEAEALGKQKQAVNQAMNADAAPVHRSQASLYNEMFKQGGAK